MKQTFLTALAVILVSLASSVVLGQSPSPQANMERTKRIIASAEREWLDAVYRLDAATIDRSESNELTIITRGATVTKQEHITAIRRRQTDLATPSRPLASYELTNQRISIYGDIAVVTDIAYVTTSEQNPITMPGRYWQTEIWRNEGNTWKLVHLHASPIPRHK